MPFITLNQSEIFYIENKISGVPLLFIHGWLGSSLEWIHQFNYFNSKQHLIILDLPGFGKSNKPKTKYSIDFFTKNILDFIKLLGYNEIILIGHSLGGIIAQNITIQKPTLVKKLILISTAATFSESFKKRITLFWVNLIFKLTYKNFLKNIIKKITSIKSENWEFRRLYNNALKIPKSVVLSTFKNMTSKFNLKNELSRISQPTLLIYGNQDEIISKLTFKNLADSIPNSEMYIIKNSPHRVNIENYIEVNKIIDDFINK